MKKIVDRVEYGTKVTSDGVVKEIGNKDEDEDNQGHLLHQALRLTLWLA
ncbi:hypothetical protein ACFL6S_01155 [Candidatus Poribacteria bacterium]